MSLLIALFYSYIFLGLVSVITHCFFGYALARSRTLLQRYCVIIAQMVANGATGVALLIAGIGRLGMFYLDYTELASRRQCILMPWNILFSWAEPMQAVSLFMVSADRLIAVSFPVMYFKKNGAIEITEVCFWNGSLMILVVISWCFSWPETEPIAEPYCWTSDGQLPFFADMFLIIIIVTSTGSVVLYIAVYAMTRKSVRSAQKIQMGSKAAEAFESRQRKLTRTMYISCVITMIFYVTPMCIRLLINDETDATLADILIVYSGISCNFTPLAILAALFVMQEDVKAAVQSSLPRCLHRLIQHRPSGFASGTSQCDILTTAIHTTQQKTIKATFFSHMPQQIKKTAVQPLSKSAIIATFVRP